MTFLVVEMVFCLLAAALLGLGLGWLLTRLTARARVAEADETWGRRLREAEEELASAHLALTALQADLQSRSDALEQAQRLESSLAGRVEELEAERSRFAADGERLGRDLQAAVDEAERAGIRYREAQEALRNALRANEGVELQLGELRSELEAAAARSSNAEERVRLLEMRLREAERVGEELAIEREALVASRSAQAQAIEERDRLIADLKRRVDARANEIEAIVSRHRSTDEMLAMLEEQLVSRSSDMSALQLELTASERTIANLEQSNQHTRRSAEGLREELRSRVVQLDETRSQLEARNELVLELERKIHALEATCASVVEQNDGLGEERLRLQRELQAMEGQLYRVESVLAQRDERVTELEREVRSREARCTTLEAEVQHRRSSAVRTDEELAAVRKRQADCEARAVALQERIAELERVIRSAGG